MNSIIAAAFASQSLPPHLWCVWCNSFDIVCLSVCLSVCYHTHGQTFGLEFWHGGQVEGNLGQVCRSNHMSEVKVTRSKDVLWRVPLTSESIVMMDLPKKKLNNTTWDVFKAYAFFWCFYCLTESALAWNAQITHCWPHPTFPAV